MTVVGGLALWLRYYGRIGVWVLVDAGAKLLNDLRLDPLGGEIQFQIGPVIQVPRGALGRRRPSAHRPG